MRMHSPSLARRIKRSSSAGSASDRHESTTRRQGIAGGRGVEEKEAVPLIQSGSSSNSCGRVRDSQYKNGTDAARQVRAGTDKRVQLEDLVDSRWIVYTAAMPIQFLLEQEF